MWNELPVQVRCTILNAWGWCTGTTQRDGMGREEGGGFRMENTCIPVADSFWYKAKPIQYCKVKKKKKRETQTYRTVFWILWEKARAGWYGRMALKHVNYHMWNESPVQVWCMIQGAWGWRTGMTQRDGMGRDVGGGFRMENTCIPVADSCQCMSKAIQYCKVIHLQLK